MACKHVFSLRWSFSLGFSLFSSLSLKSSKYLALLLFPMILTHCVVAPLHEPYTARSLGKGKSDLGVTIGIVNYSLDYMVGISDNIDIGGLIEYQRFGGFLFVGQLKWQLNSKDTQRPFALFAGAGAGNNDVAYLGAIQSFELGPRSVLSLNARLNYFKWSNVFNADEEDDEGEDFFSGILDDIGEDLAGDYFYASINVSHTLWFSERIGGTLSVTTYRFISIPSDSTVNQDRFSFLGSLGLHFKF